MSPTSYQTAPPRDLMITTVLRSVKQGGASGRHHSNFQILALDARTAMG
jgi:hypothetical protein